MKSFSKHGALALSLLALTVQGTLAQGSNMNEEDLTLSSAPYGILDNRNTPMNTPLGTVESSYARGQRDTTIRQNFGLNNAEIWKLLHCQIVKNGFEWVKPIGETINTRTCAGVSVGNTLNNPRLIEQRRMVEEYLRGQGQNKDMSNPYSTISGTTSEMAESYKQFILDRVQLLENFGTPNSVNIQEYIKAEARIFETYKHIPVEYQLQELMPLLRAYYSIKNTSKDQLRSLAHEYGFSRLEQFIKDTEHLSEKDIAFIDIGSVNGQYYLNYNKDIETTISGYLYNSKGKNLTGNFEATATSEYGKVSNLDFSSERLTADFIHTDVNPQNANVINFSIVTPQTQRVFKQTLKVVYTHPRIVAEKVIFPTDTSVTLPNQSFWGLKKGLIQQATKVKIIAQVDGGYIHYRVVYSDQPNVNVVAKGETPTLIMTSKPDNTTNSDRWHRSYDILTAYNILQFFYQSSYQK